MNVAVKAVVCLFAVGTAGAAETFVSLRGTAGGHDAPGLESVVYFDSRARLGWRGTPPGFVVRVEGESRFEHVRPRVAAGRTPFPSVRSPTAWDGDWQKNGSGWGQSVRLDRVDIAFALEAAEIQVGRQPVGLGTSHYLGVLDLVAPFAPGELDTEYRPGVDALRVRYPLGDTGEFEGIGIIGRRHDEGIWLGRGRLSPGVYDLEVIAGRFRDRRVLGMGWDGDLGGWGWWGEALVMQRRAGDFRGPDGWSPSLVSGVEGSLPTAGRVGAAVFLNGGGAWSSSGREEARFDRPHRDGWAHLASAVVGLMTWNKEPHPLWSVHGAALVSGTDGSILWQPRVTFQCADEAEVTGFVWAGTGPTTVPGSEFGGVRGAGIRLRWFF